MDLNLDKSYSSIKKHQQPGKIKEIKTYEARTGTQECERYKTIQTTSISNRTENCHMA